MHYRASSSKVPSDMPSARLLGLTKAISLCTQQAAAYLNEKLAYILDALGYEVTIREKTDHPGATAPDTKREAITHGGGVP